MIVPHDPHNLPPRNHRVRRAIKKPMKVVGLNGFNDNMFTATDSLRPTDPAPLMNDYGSLFRYGRLGEVVPGAPAETLMDKIKRYKWPLIIGGAIAAGITGFMIVRKRRS